MLCSYFLCSIGLFYSDASPTARTVESTSWRNRKEKEEHSLRKFLFGFFTLDVFLRRSKENDIVFTFQSSELSPNLALVIMKFNIQAQTGMLHLPLRFMNKGAEYSLKTETVVARLSSPSILRFLSEF